MFFWTLHFFLLCASFCFLFFASIKSNPIYYVCHHWLFFVVCFCLSFFLQFVLVCNTFLFALFFLCASFKNGLCWCSIFLSTKKRCCLRFYFKIIFYFFYNTMWTFFIIFHFLFCFMFFLVFQCSIVMMSQLPKNIVLKCL